MSNRIVKDAKETKRLFSCPICGAGYKSDGYLDRHMQEKHSDAKDDKRLNVRNVAKYCSTSNLLTAIL